MPRETDILAPGPVQEYFWSTRETFIDHPFEDLLDPEKEEQGWESVREPHPRRAAADERGQRAVRTGCYAKVHRRFLISGSLQCAREVDERAFQRLTQYPGHK